MWRGARPAWLLLLLGCLLLLGAAGASEEANFEPDGVGEAGGKGRRGGGGFMAATGSFSVSSNRAGNSEDDLGEAFDIAKQMNNHGGGAELRQQLEEKKSKVAALEMQISASESEGAKPGRQLLGAAPKPLDFDCDGDLSSMITEYDLPPTIKPKPSKKASAPAAKGRLTLAEKIREAMKAGRRGGNRGGNAEDTQDSQDIQVFTLERSLEDSEENLLQQGWGNPAQERATKAKHKRIERANKAKERRSKASAKARERGLKLKHKKIEGGHKAKAKKIESGNKEKIKAAQAKAKRIEAGNKAKNRAAEQGVKIKHNKMERAAKEKGIALDIKRRAKVCKGPGCDPCTAQMCSKHSCAYTKCYKRPRYCVRGVGCVEAKYTFTPKFLKPASLVTAKEVLTIRNMPKTELALGDKGYGMFPPPQPNAMVASSNKRCFAKLSFKRITSRVPNLLTNIAALQKTTTMDYTAHIMEASLCNAKTRKCVFKKALLSCYKWTLPDGENRCTKAESFAVVQ